MVFQLNWPDMRVRIGIILAHFVITNNTGLQSVWSRIGDVSNNVEHVV